MTSESLLGPMTHLARIYSADSIGDRLLLVTEALRAEKEIVGLSCLLIDSKSPENSPLRTRFGELPSDSVVEEIIRKMESKAQTALHVEGEGGGFCTFLDLRMPNHRIIVVVKTVAATVQSQERVTELLSNLIKTLATDSPAENLVSYEKRHEFWNKVLGVMSNSINLTIQDICNAWQAATESDWVWMWLYNKNYYLEELQKDREVLPEWQLIAVAPFPATSCPKEVTMRGATSVAEFCLRSETVVHVSDIRNWIQTYRGVEYRVQTTESLESLGCASFDCIPLLPPILPTDQQRMTPQGAICIHYKQGKRRDSIPDSSLLLMGRLTTLTMINAYHAEQRDILVKLNLLADKYLTATRRPHVLRTEYVQDIIRLIRETLHVEAVSIFYENNTATKIECLGTTGLVHGETNNPIENLHQATYVANEGLTGRCFASGNYFILAAERRKEGDTPKYIDAVNGVHLSESPVLFYPLLHPGSNEKRPALGVIRCTGKRFDFLETRTQTFNAIDLQAIDFIARQIAPVLEIMALNILRERTVNVIRHDLYVPARMILDFAAEIESKLTSRQEVNPYRIKDLTTSALLIINLASQLDLAPTEVRNIQKTAVETRIGPEIIAPIKSMLRHYAESDKEMDIEFGDFSVIPSLRLDRTLISRAVMNLVMNAIKYGDKKTKISVLPSTTKDGFMVSIINYGMGINPDEIPHLFRPHYRSERAKLKAEGVGLGLAISEAAMESHGGKVLLARSKNPTIFSLFFPKRLIYLP